MIIDGENFKKKIESVFREANQKKPFWYEYDFQGLLTKVLQGLKIDYRVFYFARIKEHKETKDKSKVLIEEQRLLKTHLEKQGFEVIMAGRVSGQKEDGILIFKEKGVDVRIAVDMVSWSCDKKVKTIILGSSDSDLQPAIKEVRRRGTECIYLGFESGPNKGMTYTTNKTILIRGSEVLEFDGSQ